MTSIFDHPLISERYFFPRPAAVPDAFRVNCGSATLACYYHQPFPEARTLVHFHGNGEIVNDYRNEFLKSVEVLGLNCFLAEYRGYGGSTGQPVLAGMLEDVATIVDALDQPHDRLILFGRSIGSLYAVHGASLYPDISGLIIESGIARPLERLLLRVQPDEVGCSQQALEVEERRLFDQRMKMGGYPGSVLVMHTRHDGLVDLSHGEALYRWASGPKKLEIFEQGNHNSIMAVNFLTYFKVVGEFAERL